MGTSDMLPVPSMSFGSSDMTTGRLGIFMRAKCLCKDPPIVFAGNVQGRHARETGPKGCMLATIRSDQSIEHVFHRLDQVRWERGHVDISGLETESDALSRTADVLDELIAAEADSRDSAGRASDRRLDPRHCTVGCYLTLIDSPPRFGASPRSGPVTGSGSRRSSFRSSRRASRRWSTGPIDEFAGGYGAVAGRPRFAGAGS